MTLGELSNLLQDFHDSTREVKVWMEDTGARRPIHAVLVDVAGDDVYLLSAEQPLPDWTQPRH
jgi:hypothetical protein